MVTEIKINGTALFHFIRSGKLIYHKSPAEDIIIFITGHAGLLDGDAPTPELTPQGLVEPPPEDK